MFLTASDRRRVTLVGLFTLLVVPAVIFFMRGEPQAEVASVAVAGIEIAPSQPDANDSPAPVFLSGPIGAAPTGTAPTAYPSADTAKLTGLATFSSFNGAPVTICNCPQAPYGMALLVKNLNNGRTVTCSNVMMPSTPANVTIVVHAELFVGLSDLVNAPIPVSITW